MIQDFKFAFRQLVKSPVFSAIAVLTLALAIGTPPARRATQVNPITALRTE